MTEALPIGRLAREAGCAVQTVRHYEQIGLMPAPERTPGGQRLYREEHLRRLAFIRHARELGFPLEMIRELLSLADEPQRSCEVVDQITRSHLESIRARITALRELETELERMTDACAGGKVSDCRIIEVLSDHSHDQCLYTSHAGGDKVL